MVETREILKLLLALVPIIPASRAPNRDRIRIDRENKMLIIKNQVFKGVLLNS